jgi:histidinol dehydrogenase
VKLIRFEFDGGDARALARQIRALQPQLGEVSEAVTEVIAAVEAEGDAALLRLERELGAVEPEQIAVPPDELRAAPKAVDEAVAQALRIAVANVEQAASLYGSAAIATSSGEAVEVGEVPVEAAGAYVPGGGGAYPTTAVMCCVPAREVGVERIAVASPPGPDGKVNPLVLAACALAGATDVYAIGGAQAVAALALGTESVSPVDLVVGPGNRYVQEAKRQLVGRVGIDGIAGPSELMVIVDEDTRLDWIALDLCAQAEHGDDGLLVACAVEPDVLSGLADRVERLAAERDEIGDAPFALVRVGSTREAAALADALAPEHLQLACGGAEALAASVRFAGCVLVGQLSATAFGDYAVGSNHVLPTGGAGRFSGPLGPSSFLRKTSRVELTRSGAEGLAPTVATLARAEGFPLHAESVEARIEES